MKRMKFLLPVVLMITLCSFAAADWMEIKNKDGGFKISFPKKPQESSEDMNTEIGTITLHMLMYDVDGQTDENMTYGLTYMDFPGKVINSDLKDEQLEVLFKNSIDGAAKNIDGKVVSVKNEVFKGYPGRLAKITFGKGVMNMKMCLVKNRMFMLEAGCEKGMEDNSYVGKFFGSFDLLGSK